MPENQTKANVIHKHKYQFFGRDIGTVSILKHSKKI
jgi:hypothetical protein